MDIRFLNQAPGGRASETESADLLSRLRAAGKVEAVVISRLADSLLLQTPLGRIETANRLQFQPGDRLELRVSGTPEQPVLKARDTTAHPRVLEIATSPRLIEALPAERTLLASIVRVMAETTLIRITDRLLTLPTRLEQPRGQLLALSRDPLTQTVSIEPIERKRLYLALIRQLLPRQVESRSVDLVRFYQLAVEATQAQAGRPVRGLQAQAGSSQVGERSAPSAPARSAAPGTPVPTQRSSAITGAPRVDTPVLAKPILPPPTLSLKPGATFHALQPASRQAAAGHSTASASAVNAYAASAAVKSPQAALTRELTVPLVVTDPKHARPAQPSHAATLTRAAIRPASDAGRATGKAGRTVSDAGRFASTLLEPDLPLPRRPAISGTSPSSVRPAGLSAGPSLPAANLPTAAAINPAGAALPSGSAPLSQLFATLPSLQQLDAATLRRWFEDLGFVRPAAAAPARAGGSGPLPLLQALNHGDSLLRALLQLGTPTPHNGAEKENRNTRSPPAETLLPWVREGIRLVEQALSQNLLQRASLGLQQETQQPASLGFALPVLDEQQVKPLQIELAQKQSARGAPGGAWEVQIDFEFAGLGPVSCHVFLDGFSVAASFYCALEQTRERVEQALPELRRQLDAAGFVAGELHGFTAAANPAKARQANRLDEALLDVEA